MHYKKILAMSFAGAAIASLAGIALTRSNPEDQAQSGERYREAAVSLFKQNGFEIYGHLDGTAPPAREHCYTLKRPAETEPSHIGCVLMDSRIFKLEPLAPNRYSQ